MPKSQMASIYIKSKWNNLSAHYPESLSAKLLKNKNNSNDSEESSERKNSFEDLAKSGYKIGRILGEGSYCKVREATWEGKSIAVKIITRQQLSEDFESKFLPREIDALRKVRHPNVIHVHKIFDYPRRIFIFMELIQRGDLLAHIRTRGRLKEEETRRYFRQIVSALKYLHSLAIAHRDLKCENIMINDDDEIKIIDFGFCRSTVSDDGRRELSRTFCGSTAYAAPEVLKGVPYNPMMYDVWSLGCVLFIMITGTMPFDDTNVRRMVTYQMKRQYSYPNTFLINQEIKDLIRRMLEPDVTRRATLDQVSRCHWLKESMGTSAISHVQTALKSLDASATTKETVVPKSLKSAGTQTSYYSSSEEFLDLEPTALPELPPDLGGGQGI